MSESSARPGPKKKIHPGEVEVDDDLVGRLVAAQFPAWAPLALRRVASTGTDNVIYRLGDRLGLRLPRIHWAVPQIAKEYEWLPRLAAHLPASVPEPVALGEPGEGYRYPWLVSQWVDGADAMAGPIDDWGRLAGEVAGFVAALQSINIAGAPPSRDRGGPLASHDGAVRRAISELDGTLDARRAVAVWEEALAAGNWAGPPVWVHGDLLPGNVVVSDGRLAGVIDWSAAGLGDPACEAMLAWAMPPDARAVYRAALGFDDATWARGRGWALEQAALFIPYYAQTIPDAVAAARLRLRALLSDTYARGEGPTCG